MIELAKIYAETKDSDELFIDDTIASQKISYKKFWRDALVVADKFSKVKEEKIITLLENSYLLLVIYMAAALAEKIISPIEPRKSLEDIRKLLVGDFVVVAEDSFKGVIAGHELRLNLLADECGTSLSTLIEKVDSGAPYLLTYTSGTSGKSKGVLHSLENLISCADAFATHTGLAKAVFLHAMPMSYMAGILNSFILPLITGSRIVLAPRFSLPVASGFWETIRMHNINYLWLSPMMLTMILRLDRTASKVLPLNIFVGTAPLMESTRLEFEKRYGAKLYQSYGLSETLFVSCVTAQEHSELENPYVGSLLPGVTLKRASDGELGIKSTWNMLGYTNEDNAKYYDGDYYLTGDIGEVDGVLKIADRKKDLIIRGGINLSPKLIEESIMKSFTLISECSAVASVSASLGEQVALFVVMKDGARLENIKAEILAAVRALGDGYAVDKLVERAVLPRNINGKIDRKKLQAEVLEGQL